VTIMDKIIVSTEQDFSYRRIVHALTPEPEATAADAICKAASQVATTISAAVIVTYTQSGSTALRAARERPDVPFVLLTTRTDTARRLSLLWGAHCVQAEDARNTAEMVQKARRIAVQQGYAGSGQKLVIIAGVPFGHPGTTNLLRIAWID